MPPTPWARQRRIAQRSALAGPKTISTCSTSLPTTTCISSQSPDPTKETNGLWDWDVVEAFVGSDYKNIRQYKELEVSPRGEWVDLNIDLDKESDRDAIKWNSGYKVAAHIDGDKKIWYAAMKIPFSSIDNRAPTPGQTLRIGLFRCAGSPANRLILSWRPTMSMTFHSPEHFGSLLLAPSKNCHGTACGISYVNQASSAKSATGDAGPEVEAARCWICCRKIIL